MILTPYKKISQRTIISKREIVNMLSIFKQKQNRKVKEQL